MLLQEFEFYSHDETEITEALVATKKNIQAIRKPGNYKILLVSVEPIRSLRQNAYYWLILQIVEDWTGHDRYELHRIFKTMFLLEVRETTKREIIVVPGSTAEAKRKNFQVYLDKIRLFVLDFMGVDGYKYDQVLPPINQITEEMLWKAGIKT